MSRCFFVPIVLVMSVTVPAAAAPIGFTFNGGPVLSISSDAPTDITSFQIGEDLLFTFSIESTTPDSDPDIGAGRFFDPVGTITVRGASSNHELVLAGGVDFDLDNSDSFELDDVDPNFPDPPVGSFILDADTDLIAPAGFGLLSDPDNLEQSIQDLANQIGAGFTFEGFRNQESFIAGINLIGTNSTGDPVSQRMLEFGPVPTDVGRGEEIGFSYNAGPVQTISDDAPDAFSTFQIGEDVIVNFLIDSGILDTDPLPDVGFYRDAMGQIQLTGAESGTVVDLDGGIELLLNRDEFELDEGFDSFTLGSAYLEDDTDLLAPFFILSDPENLSQSLAELEALLDSNGVFKGFDNQSSFPAGVDVVTSRDENGDPVVTRVLSFGTVVAEVPLPAGLPLMLAGFGVMALVARRRAARDCQMRSATPRA